MDYIGYLVIGVLGLLIGVATSTYSLWRLKKDQFFEQIIENVIEDLSNDKVMQENLYNIGGLIGQGAKTGIGLATPSRSGGKINLQNFLIEMAGQFFQSKIQNPSSLPAPLSSPQTQGISGQKNRDKW